MLSETVEMYLITIYRLTNHEEYAHINDIAEMLGLHHSSVSEKVRRLSEEGYVVTEPHRGVRLTKEGHQIAIGVVRKHRLIKTFLVRMAGYAIDEVYDEACSLEHAVSSRLADSLEKLLDFPKFDPHGYPIPTREGEVHEVQYKTLGDFEPGDTVIVRRVDALHHEKLTYLRKLGLVPSTTVLIRSIGPFDGPMMLDVNGNTIAIAPSLAREIEVSPVGESQSASRS